MSLFLKKYSKSPTVLLVSAAVFVTGAWISLEASSDGVGLSGSLSWNKTYSGYKDTTFLYNSSNGAVRNPNFSVQYSARVLDSSGAVFACGSTVPAGSTLQFVFDDHKRTDISWFVTGGAFDSPYGSWNSGLAAPSPAQICSEGSVIAARKGHRANGLYIVNPPKKTLTGVSGANCSNTSGGGKTCSASFSKPGTYTAKFNFGATKSVMYWKYWNSGKGGRRYGGKCNKYPYTPRTITWAKGSNSFKKISIPAESWSCKIIVDETPNKKPTKPQLNADNAVQCVVGTPMNIQMSSTDADGDQVRYLIDWDGNGSVDQTFPTSGYVASGATQIVQRIFSTTGNKNIQVRAQDSRGALSSWATLSFTCTGAKLGNDDGDGDENSTSITSGDDGSGNGTGNVADLIMRAVPSIVSPGATTRIHWSTNRMNSCTVVGSNGDRGTSWNVLETPTEGLLTTGINEATTYTLSCRDGNNNLFEKNATVYLVPQWQEF